MSYWSRSLAWLGCGMSLCACTVPTSEDVDGEPVASVQQPLVTMPIYLESGVSSSGYAVADCAGLDYAMGNGSMVNSGEITSHGPTWRWDPTRNFRLTKGAAAKAVADNVWAQAVCTPAPMVFVPKVDSDGDATANCGPGATAVGGGGYCHNSSARLRRSRPQPTSGEPNGWRATCTSGKVTAAAVCAIDDLLDYKPVNCEVKMASSNATTVHCDSNQHAVAAGAYCKSGENIRNNQLSQDLESAAAVCTGISTGSGTHVNAYAICCSGVAFDG